MHTLSKWPWLLFLFCGPFPLPFKLTSKGVLFLPGKIAFSREKLVKWNMWALLNHFSTKTQFNGCWKWVALSDWILDCSGQGVLSGFLFWPSSGECKHCEGMVRKANLSPPHSEKETNEDPAAALPRMVSAQKRLPINTGKNSRAVASPLGSATPSATTP